MIPRIRRVKDKVLFGKCRYIVEGWVDTNNYGPDCSDACVTLLDAFRYWLYHCNVSPKICFWSPFKKKNES